MSFLSNVIPSAAPYKVMMQPPKGKNGAKAKARAEYIANKDGVLVSSDANGNRKKEKETLALALPGSLSSGKEKWDNTNMPDLLDF